MSSINGKAAGVVRGVLGVKRKSLVVQETPSKDPEKASLIHQKAAAAGAKRRTSSPSTVSPVASTIVSPFTTPRLEYVEKNGILLGTVDEEVLMQQIQTVRSVLFVLFGGLNGCL